ncbi:PQQ-binding-like beta-propeller repeat protein [candidate division KSB1 bacterium]
MKHTNRLIAAITGCVILINFSVAFAQDWPQWRGANRDGKVAGFEIPAEWPAELTPAWKITVGASNSTPALVNGRLYVFTRQGTEEVLRCLDAESGKELWQDRYTAQAVTGAASRGHPGPRSSPTVSEGKVITLGVGGMLSCLEAETGKVVWRKDEYTGAVPVYYTGMSPIVVDNICIAHLGGSDSGVIIAFDMATGREMWKRAGNGPAYGSPVLLTAGGTKQVIVQAEKNIVSLAAADGRLLWQTPTPPQRRFYNSATPIVDGQTVFYTGHGLGTKAVTVQKQGDDFTVTELWSNSELGTAYNTPVLKDGFLFGLSDRGRMYCLNAVTGQTAWTDNSGHRNFCSLLDAGSVIIALPSESGLIVYKPNSNEYEELARINVADTPVYAHPVISGNRIYVKDEETLMMFVIE